MNARAFSPPGKPIARGALYEEVAELLRQRIYAHELAPGAWIDEQALAESFGISRTPMREALKVLASEGLVRLEPRRGCYVAELSEQDLDEIFSVAALLEGRVAFEAAAKLTDTDLARLSAAYKQLERHAAANDADRYFEANQAFHAALQEIAGNRWLKQMIDDTRKVINLTRRDSLNLKGRLKHSLAEHRAILKALAARDADGASRAMHGHLLSGRAALARLRSTAVSSRLTPHGEHASPSSPRMSAASFSGDSRGSARRGPSRTDQDRRAPPTPRYLPVPIPGTSTRTLPSANSASARRSGSRTP